MFSNTLTQTNTPLAVDNIVKARYIDLAFNDYLLFIRAEVEAQGTQGNDVCKKILESAKLRLDFELSRRVRHE